MIETNLVDAGMSRLASDVEVSESTSQILQELHEKVIWSLRDGDRRDLLG